MLAALRHGDWLSFVMDQKPIGRQGPEVDFFGHKVAFVSGPAAMSIKTGAPILAVYCFRIGPARYRLKWEVIDPQGTKKTVDTLTAELAHSIEGAIRLYPEQWCWNYKRWKFRPALDT
jgi:KDO2-lipid IV(A) lauroyltransferase